jgi:hypothetical protein
VQDGLYTSHPVKDVLLQLEYAACRGFEELPFFWCHALIVADHYVYSLTTTRLLSEVIGWPAVRYGLKTSGSSRVCRKWTYPNSLRQTFGGSDANRSSASVGLPTTPRSTGRHRSVDRPALVDHWHAEAFGFARRFVSHAAVQARIGPERSKRLGQDQSHQPAIDRATPPEYSRTVT